MNAHTRHANTNTNTRTLKQGSGEEQRRCAGDTKSEEQRGEREEGRGKKCAPFCLQKHA